MLARQPRRMRTTFLLAAAVMLCTCLSLDAFGGHYISSWNCCVSPKNCVSARARCWRRRSTSPSASRSLTTASAMYLGGFLNRGPKKQLDDETEATDTTKEMAAKSPKKSVVDHTYEEPDPVERIFSFFFGKKETAPLGMARFGPDRFPEQYPATKTDWALPVPDDDTHVAIVRPFLKNTNLERRPLRLAYDANRHGWNAVAFHKKVDRKGPSLVVCTTTSGLTCGGYNPKGWVGYGEARGSIAAFLFIVNGKPSSSTGLPGMKLCKVGGPGLAQMDMPENGPSFGVDSLVIPLGNSNSRLARSKLGSYYERMPDGGSSLFGKESSVELKDLKVYQGVYKEGEFVPFTDAEPFALY